MVQWLSFPLQGRTLQGAVGINIAAKKYCGASLKHFIFLKLAHYWYVIHLLIFLPLNFHNITGGFKQSCCLVAEHRN